MDPLHLFVLLASLHAASFSSFCSSPTTCRNWALKDASSYTTWPKSTEYKVCKSHQLLDFKISKYITSINDHFENLYLGALHSATIVANIQRCFWDCHARVYVKNETVWNVQLSFKEGINVTLNILQKSNYGDKGQTQRVPSRLAPKIHKNGIQRTNRPWKSNTFPLKNGHLKLMPSFRQFFLENVWFLASPVAKMEFMISKKFSLITSWSVKMKVTSWTLSRAEELKPETTTTDRLWGNTSETLKCLSKNQVASCKVNDFLALDHCSQQLLCEFLRVFLAGGAWPWYFDSRPVLLFVPVLLTVVPHGIASSWHLLKPIGIPRITRL